MRLVDGESQLSLVMIIHLLLSVWVFSAPDNTMFVFVLCCVIFNCGFLEGEKLKLVVVSIIIVTYNAG